MLLDYPSATVLKGQSVHNTPMMTLRKPLVSIGIKAGFNSSLFFTDRLVIGGEEITGVQNNYKVGYFAAAFCRFNLKNTISFSRNFHITYQKEVLLSETMLKIQN